MQRRLWLTVLALGLYRIGRHVPVPGLDTEPLGFLFYRSSLRNYEMFASVSRLMTVCSQGIMPYISASIVILILSQFIPRLRALRKGDRSDQLAFDRLILGMTIIICFAQGFLMAMSLEGLTRMGGESLVLHPGWGFRLLTAITMTTGTMILVWLAYQVTRRGLGNGVLIFLMAGLLDKTGLGLVATMQTIQQRGFLLAQEHTLLEIILRVAIPVAIFLVAVCVVLAGHRIRIRKIEEPNRGHPAGDGITFPLRFNMTGAIPVYVATKVLAFVLPAGALFLGVRIPPPGWADGYPLWYWLLLWPLIFIMTYFISSVVFDGDSLRSSLKRFGFRISDLAPPQKAMNFFDRIMNKTVLLTAVFLCLLAVAPQIFEKYGGLSKNLSALFGPRLLILVAGSMELYRQIGGHIAFPSRPPTPGTEGKETTEDDAAHAQVSQAPLWTSLLVTPTILNAWLIAAILQRSAVDAAVFSTRTVGITGSLGMWEATTPSYPSLTVHRRLAGGEVMVMVPAPDLEKAREILTSGVSVNGDTFLETGTRSPANREEKQSESTQ